MNIKSVFIWLLAGLMMLTVAACDSPEEKATQHYNDGMAFIKEGNFVKAGIEFRNALQLKENYADGWYGLALVEENAKNWRKYAGDVLKAIELNPEHVPAQVRYGKIMLLSGRLEDALKTSDLVSKLAPEDSEVLALKAAVLYKLGDKENAVKAAISSLAVDPSNIDAIAVLAAERLENKDPDGAVAILDEGLSHSKDSIPLQITKIRALSSINKTDEIIKVFQELIAAYPENTEFKKSLMRFYLKNDQKVEAEEVVRNIAKENPDDVDAKLDVVRFVKTVKGDEEAVAELEHLINEYPDVYRYRFALASLAQIMNDGEKAQTILQSIVTDAKAPEDALEARNKLAQIEMSKGNTAEAETLVKEVLAIDQQNTNALVLYGALLVDEGKIEEAISNLRSSLKQRPESVRSSLLLAKAHEINGSLELAEDRFAAAYRYSKETPDIGLLYAQFFLRHSEAKRAEDLLEKIVQTHPRDKQALKTLAQVKLMQQDWAAAEELAEKIRNIDDSDVTAFQITGAALAGMQNPDDSENAFEKAYEETPKAGQSMVTLVQAYMRNGKVDKAESFLKSVLASSEDNYQAKLLLAQIEFGKRQNKEAVQLIQEAIAQDSSQEAGYVMLVKYYMATNQAKEAEKILIAGLEEQPDSFVLNLTQAGIYELNGNLTEAIATYEKMLKTRPNSEIVVNNLASLIADEAVDKEGLRRAYTLAKRFRSTKVPYFKDTLGWIHYRLGEYELAIPLLKEAAEQLPALPILQYHLGMAYKADNNKAEAMTALEAALKLANNKNFPQAEEAKKALDELRASPN